MAVTKTISTTSFSIEVKKGVDKAGDPVFSKKSFSNIRNGVENQNVYDIAEAIKGVLEAETGHLYLNESSSLANA